MLKLIIVTFLLTAGGEQKYEQLIMSDAPCELLALDIGNRIDKDKRLKGIKSFKVECSNAGLGE